MSVKLYVQLLTFSKVFSVYEDIKSLHKITIRSFHFDKMAEKLSTTNFKVSTKKRRFTDVELDTAISELHFEILERPKTKVSFADLIEEQFQIPPGKFVFFSIVYFN